MADKVKLLAFSGSTREGSFNRMLLGYAVEGARDAGAVVTELNLSDYEMPLYDGDLEEREGIPEAAMELKELFHAYHGFLIASPEYNGFFPALLKNALDWISRPSTNGTSLVPYKGKVAGLMAASPGGLGGVRGLTQLRLQLTNLQVLVLPQQVNLSMAQNLFDENGNLTDDKKAAQAHALGQALVSFGRRVGVHP